MAIQQIDLARINEAADRGRAFDQQQAQQNRLQQIYDSAFANGIPTAGPQRQQLVGDLARVDPRQGMQWAQYFSGLDEATRKRAQAEAPVVYRALGGANAQNYGAIRSGLAQYGIDTTDWPEQYDPNAIGTMRSAAGALVDPSQGAYTLGADQVRYDANGNVIARGPAKAGGGLFGGASVDAQALNFLVQAGRMTPEQAAMWAAGKTVAGPNGAVDFIAPMAVGGGQQSQQPSPGQSAPAATQQPAPGVTNVRPAQEQGMNPVDRRLYARREATLQNVQNSLNEYRKLLREVGPTFKGAMDIPSAGAERLQTAHTGLMIELKNLFELGALSGPDYDLMVRTVGDPNTLRSWWAGSNVLEEQLGVVNQMIENARNTARAQYGIEQPQIQPQRPSGAGQRLRYNPETDSLEPVE